MENNRIKKFKIELLEHNEKMGGEQHIYLYKCGNYIFKIDTAFGETDVEIVGRDAYYQPSLIYSKTGSVIDWKTSIPVTGDKWKIFVQEVQDAHATVAYFNEHIDKLKQGIIPDQEN